MREKHFIAAFDEYKKRLGAYCRFELTELTEERLGDDPSDKEIANALEREALAIEKNIPKDAYVIAMCVEGKEKSSPELAARFNELALSGRGKLCFIVGGSFGIAERIKQRADERLSMSRMTFPHHLARVMLAEQIYRAFTINEGKRYHK
jgi:23S rRNA (pseudouridine1915-N3)-methyltransferase